MTHPATRTPARTKNMPAAVYAAVSLVVEEHQAFFIMYLIQFMLSDIYLIFDTCRKIKVYKPLYLVGL